MAQVTLLLEEMSTAIALAGSVTILAGIAVLIGAIAASRQARAYDSVILKPLGATRWQILGAQALGLLAGWFVVVRIFEFGWSPYWALVLATLGAGALLTLGVGLL